METVEGMMTTRGPPHAESTAAAADAAVQGPKAAWRYNMRAMYDGLLNYAVVTGGRPETKVSRWTSRTCFGRWA